MELLIKNGVDENATDSSGKTASQVTKSKGKLLSLPLSNNTFKQLKSLICGILFVQLEGANFSNSTAEATNKNGGMIIYSSIGAMFFVLLNSLQMLLNNNIVLLTIL